MGFGWIRVHYMLLYAVVGAYLPYAPLYFHQRGLGDAQIGWVIGVYGLAVLAMPAAMTYLADRSVANRTIIGVGYAATAAALIGLWASEGFWGLLVCSLAFSVAYTPTFALLDGLTFGAMAEAKGDGRTPPPYHRTRLWGSVGFMLPSAVILWLLWTDEPGADVRPALLLACGCAVAAAVTSVWLPAPRREQGPPNGRDAASGRPAIIEPEALPGATKPVMPSVEAWRAMRRKPVMAFMGAMVLLFLAISVFYGFFSRYLQELAIAERWVGVILNVGVAAEIGVILLSGRLLRWIGLRGVLVIGAVSMTLRMAMLAAWPNAWVAIASQVLHGPTVLAIYVIPPMYLNHKASPAFRNSMQGLYGVLCFGAARVVGSVLGGYAAEAGLRWAFAMAAVLSAAATGWLIVRFRDETACAAIEREVRAQEEAG